MRRLLTAAGIGLSTLPAAADLPPEVWFSPCDGPAATCVSPRAEHLSGYALVDGPRCRAATCRPVCFLTSDGLPVVAEYPPSGPAAVALLGGHEPRLTPIADDAHEILGRWEFASRAHLPTTDAERLRLKYDRPGRSGQELALTCELQGPVDAADLGRRYNWSVTDDADAVELTAVPKDRLERLFYDRFTVTLDPADWRPTAIRFVTPDGRRGPAVALRPWVDAGAADVRLVAFESPVPAAKPVRTADLSDDAPRPLRDDFAPLALPPAPAPCDLDAPEPIEAPKP